MIEVRDLGVRGEDGTAVLTSVSVVLDRRRTAVIGDNGSGKSTFARVLAGLVRPTTGSASVLGVDVRDRRLRETVGMVFSDPDAQILMPTPREDVALTAGALPLPRDQRRGRVDEALARFGLASLADTPAAVLSGGQKQLLALAGVTVRRPAVLIADEPTAQLDLRNARRIGGLLLGDAAPGTTGLTDWLVLVTHDLALARRCDHALRFAHGRLVDHGAPDAVIDRYERECG